MKTEEIKNVLIFDGEKEYSKMEILKDKTLTALMNSVINFGGFPTIIEKINEENGLLYIITDLSHSSGTGDLRNVSLSLYSEFLSKRP
jgi:hypothetical protein